MTMSDHNFDSFYAHRVLVLVSGEAVLGGDKVQLLRCPRLPRLQVSGSRRSAEEVLDGGDEHGALMEG